VKDSFVTHKKLDLSQGEVVAAIIADLTIKLESRYSSSLAALQDIPTELLEAVARKGLHG